MENRDFSPLRRTLLTAFGGAALGGALLRALRFPALGQSRPSIALRATARKTKLKADLPESPIWVLEAEGNSASLRFTQGDDLQVSLSSELSALTTWNWIGFDGASSAEPLISQKPLAKDARAAFSLPLRQAGTFLIDTRMLGDGKERPSAARALIVQESVQATTPPAVDRDEVLLLEDWRVMPDGRALAPGVDPKDAAAAYTVNGQPNLDIKLRPNERLRLRVINGCQRAPIGVRIENHDVRVIAIDSQPAEPFLANKGQLVMAPGSRTDVLIDATQPPGSSSGIFIYDGATPTQIARLVTTNDAPARATPLPAAVALSSAHLPAQLDLKNAMRVDVQLDAKAPWIAPADFTTAMPPLFQAKRARVVVMTITNPTKTITAFRLHGHHFRLLDRLDDGWKPFWLDTLLLSAGQTQRIAFLAEYSGQWLIEATGIDWASLRLVRSYTVG
jgi:FtsP/CotA-like multicopper oxidase with cupredoxin domain